MRRGYVPGEGWGVPGGGWRVPGEGWWVPGGGWRVPGGGWSETVRLAPQMLLSVQRRWTLQGRERVREVVEMAEES